MLRIDQNPVLADIEVDEKVTSIFTVKEHFDLIEQSLRRLLREANRAQPRNNNALILLPQVTLSQALDMLDAIALRREISVCEAIFVAIYIQDLRQREQAQQRTPTEAHEDPRPTCSITQEIIQNPIHVKAESSGPQYHEFEAFFAYVAQQVVEQRTPIMNINTQEVIISVDEALVLRIKYYPDSLRPENWAHLAALRERTQAFNAQQARSSEDRAIFAALHENSLNIASSIIRNRWRRANIRDIGHIGDFMPFTLGLPFTMYPLTLSMIVIPLWLLGGILRQYPHGFFHLSTEELFSAAWNVVKETVIKTFKELLGGILCATIVSLFMLSEARNMERITSNTFMKVLGVIMSVAIVALWLMIEPWNIRNAAWTVNSPSSGAFIGIGFAAIIGIICLLSANDNVRGEMYARLWGNAGNSFENTNAGVQRMITPARQNAGNAADGQQNQDRVADTGQNPDQAANREDDRRQPRPYYAYY